MLALTVYEDKSHLRKLLKAGASGYILKLATGEELIRALRVVAAGGVYLDPVLAGKVVGDIVNEGAETGQADGTPLTERESQVDAPRRPGVQQQGDRRASSTSA